MTFTPAAAWSPDCNGKQNYDGQFLSISTRYWPAWKSADARPSAHASILVSTGPLDDPEDRFSGDVETIADEDFAADTETEVKAAVEAWVAAQCEAILSRIRG